MRLPNKQFTFPPEMPQPTPLVLPTSGQFVAWVSASPTDAREIHAISKLIHPELPERCEVFEEKIRLSPRSCLKLVADKRCVGYALAHPWMFLDIPALDAFLERLPSHPDCLYMHDVAILEGFRSHGAAALYVKYVKELAQTLALPRLALVSVRNAAPYWMKHGFVETTNPSLKAKLHGYGPNAKYLVCEPVAS
jgi:GNAT superfamily N-acetyltransferase